MSQFKSRVPSGLNFTPKEGVQGGDQGYCCSNTGDGSYTTATRYECFLKNGFFVLSDPANTCPKVYKDKCCLYNADNTLQGFCGGVAYCKCNSLNYPYKTKFVNTGAGATCPTIYYNDASLVEEYGACCYWKLESGAYVNRCQTVGNYDLCGQLHEGGDEGLKFSYYAQQKCVIDGGDVVCNSGKKLTQDQIDSRPECIPDTDNDCYKEQNILGNCCTLLTDGTRECTISSKEDCPGYWSYNGNVLPCSGTTLCSGIYFPDKVDGVYVPTTASLTSITNTTNSLEALPSEPTLYQGGLYLGIFQPGSTINVNGSSVYGNILTGDPANYQARGTGAGTRNKKWILIAAPEDISIDAGTVITPDSYTSAYDGFYNTDQGYTQFHKNIRKVNINGFTDWYLPSQDELAFFFKNISSTSEYSGFTKPSSAYYLTSTFYSVNSDNKLSTIGNKYFMYTQSASSTSYGKVVLMPQENYTYKARLFRRIYLGV